MTVYKLGYDSKVYAETINVTPDRAALGTTTTYDLGNLLIQTQKVNGVNIPVATPWYNEPIILDLAQMFTNLGTVGTQDWIDDAVLNGTTAELKQGSDKNGDFIVAANIDFLPATGTTATTDKTKIARMRITPVYAKNSGADPSIAPSKLDKAHALTINFKDAATNGYTLNTVVVNFTPVIPSLADVFAREASYWKGDVLQAYYVNPAPSFITDPTKNADTEYDMAPAFKNLEAIANLDVVFELNANQEIGSTPIATLATLTGTTIEIVQDPTPADDPYKKPIDIFVDETNTNYMGLYTYDNASDYNFKVEVMSALFEGELAPVSGAAITLNAGDVATGGMDITEAKVIGKTYTGFEYSIFKNKDGNYDYSYVKSVEFVKVGNQYNIVGAGGGYVNSVAPSAPVLDADGKIVTPSRVQLVGNNLASGTVQAKIKIRVTDRFFKVLEQDVDVNIVVP